MEDSKKKPIMLGIILVCLGLAIFLTVRRAGSSGGGLKSVKAGRMMWVKCSNPDCNSEYQMDEKDFYEAKNQNRGAPLVCKDCEEESIYRAEKCNGCGMVFFRGAVRGELADKCPECGYSQMEEDRKQ